MKLAQEFIPAADNVSRLQSGNAPDCLHFQKVGEQGHYGGRTRPSATRQGTYAAAPSGLLLASLNSNNPDRVLQMMESALDKWKSLAREQRLLPDAPAAVEKISWQALYPASGLVLSVTNRDLPRESPSSNDSKGKSWNRDYAWFTREEAAALVPEEARIGASRAIAQDLVNRLYRLHLVDSVRGETQPFPVNGIEKATLASRVTEVKGDTVKLHLEGETRLTNEGVWSIAGFRDMQSPSPQKRGYDAKLLGRATFDRAKQRFTDFEMLAVGMRWGATQYNGRANDRDPAPMAVAFTLAGSAPAERVPPAFLGAYGWK